MVQRDQPIDATIDIVTPENISFRYRIAGPYRRLPAFFIDIVLRFGVWLGFVILVNLLTGGFLMRSFLGQAITGVLFFLMEWLYGGLLETYWNGQTVGKRVMGIRVLSIDGQPINGLQAVLRNILRMADFMPPVPYSAVFDVVTPVPIPTFVIGLVTTLLTKRFQRLGDIVCGTMVVVDEKSWLFEPAKLDDPRVAQLATELPPSFAVSRSLAKALATYVDRRQLFSPARRREIARHVAKPLLAKFGFPDDTSYDLLLCALYHRTFLIDNDEDVALPNVYAEMEQKMVEARKPMILPRMPQAASSPPTVPGATAASDGTDPNSNAIPPATQPAATPPPSPSQPGSQTAQGDDLNVEPGSPFKPGSGGSQS